MKKLLFFLLLPMLVFSQDMQYAASLNNLTKEQVREVSDDIMSTFSVPQKYYASTKNDQGNYFAIYYPVDLPDRIIKEDFTNGICNLCNSVEFGKYMKGSNADLGIAGTETYKLQHISGKYLDLFGWWQKHFAPTSTKEKLLEKDRDLRYIEDRTKDINIRFVNNFDSWEIRNIH